MLSIVFTIFPRVRKKHYLMLQVYVDISESSLILLKKFFAFSPFVQHPNTNKETNNPPRFVQSTQ